jgi:hypothetical protein
VFFTVPCTRDKLLMHDGSMLACANDGTAAIAAARNSQTLRTDFTSASRNRRTDSAAGVARSSPSPL